MSVRLTDGEDEVFLGTNHGYSIRFPESQIHKTGRATRGVRGIKLRKDDSVVEMAIVDKGDVETILSVTENGYGKRTRFEVYRKQSRGGLGTINLKVTKKTGRVVGIKSVREEDEVMLITSKGKIIRMRVSDIRVIGRATQGVKLIEPGAEDRVVAVACRETGEVAESNGE